MPRLSLIILSVILLVNVSLASEFKCLQDEAVDEKLRDKAYTDHVMKCVMGTEKCETKLEKNIRRLAPDVLRGLCPGLCDKCTRKQIQKAIAFVQHEYPEEFTLLMTNFRG